MFKLLLEGTLIDLYSVFSEIYYSIHQTLKAVSCHVYVCSR